MRFCKENAQAFTQAESLKTVGLSFAFLAYCVFVVEGVAGTDCPPSATVVGFIDCAAF
jgi:hypothetical protein